MDGSELLCVKFLKDDKSSISEKDYAIVNLTISIKKTDKVLDELQAKIEELKSKAREALLKKDKQVK